MAIPRDFAASLKALSEPQFDIITQNLKDGQPAIHARLAQLIEEMAEMVRQLLSSSYLLASC